MLYDGPPFIVSGESSELSLAFLGFRRFLQYPLAINTAYNVTVGGDINIIKIIALSVIGFCH